jgi:predicted O-linked N-acetylglucosamine transferase (SPINDLY family)
VRRQRPRALCRRAEVSASSGRHQEAIALALEALRMDARCAPALYRLGSSRLQLGMTREALDPLLLCAQLAPDDPGVHNNLGLALAGERRFEEAIRAYGRALILRPAYARALNNRGLARVRCGDFARALEDLDAALALEPDYPAALVNRGLALAGLGRIVDALEAYRRAFPAPQALHNASGLLKDLNRVAEALECAARVMAATPDLEEAAGNYHLTALYAAAWDDYDARIDRILAGVRAGRRPAVPFAMLSVADSPADQRRVAAAHAATLGGETPLWAGERYRHARIRVAYLSADFFDHATSYLAAGLFERHDRARFDVHALSHGVAAPGPMRERLSGAFQHFVDVSSLTTRQLATRIRELEIDILVDLKGYTGNSRVDVLAHRPAPIQAHYLGYPGTLGAPWIDYLIADRIVAPRTEHAHYSESIVTLPGCYQVTDDKRAVAAAHGEREAAQLPASGPVLCAFHQIYKLNPRVFDVWMSILRRVEDAWLWLLADDPEPRARLRSEAARRGVDPARLVFASRVAHAEHLARHRLADLYLDAWPVNAHTSASDALWAGLPVIALQGQSFAARVSSSVLHAAGLEDCIAHGPDEYCELVVSLCRDPARLARLRQRVLRDVRRSALFDTARFTRSLEHAYQLMYERHRSGLAPGPIEVPAAAPSP